MNTNKTFQSLVHVIEDYDNLSFVERDVRNCVSEQRCILGKKENDQVLLKHCSCMRELNKKLLFDIDMDE